MSMSVSKFAVNTLNFKQKKEEEEKRDFHQKRLIIIVNLSVPIERMC